MKNGNVDSQKNVNAEKKKRITVLGIYLSGNTNNEEILLVKDRSKNSGFKLPGGEILEPAKRKRLVKRRKHNLKKFVFMQSGFNLAVVEAADGRASTTYSFAGEKIVVFLLKYNPEPASLFWYRNKNFEYRFVKLEEILNGIEKIRINQTDKIILKHFFSKRRSQEKNVILHILSPEQYSQSHR
jgi:hypothetical protein